MLIAKDTPREILDLLHVLDYSKIPPGEAQTKMNELENVINKYRSFIPLRKPGNFDAIDVNIPGCPQRLVDIANKNHWSKIKPFNKMIAIPFIKKWFYSNLPTRKT